MIDRLVWSEHGADWPHRSATRFVRAAGITWHVQHFSAQQSPENGGYAPRILLLHGTGASTHSWADLIPLLITRAEILAMDLPGHAFSEPLPSDQMSLPGMADALGALLEELRFRPALGVGHSAGAAILARMCLDRMIEPSHIVGLNAALLPFRGLGAALFSPLARLMARTPLVPLLFARHASDRRAVDRLIAGTGSVIPERSAQLYARLTQCRAHVAAALAMMAAWDLLPLVRDLPRLSQPLTLVVGGNDTTIDPAQAFEIEKLVAVRTVYLRGLGHLMHEERPSEIAPILLGALSTEPSVR